MFFAAFMRALGSRVEMPSPPPGTPHPARFAAPGSLARELEQAGFREIDEERLIVPIPWPGPPEQFCSTSARSSRRCVPCSTGYRPASSRPSRPR
jgi:hypothetical protein